jgi:F-type H+-transporting ATPase subunit epsilon
MVETADAPAVRSTLRVLRCVVVTPERALVDQAADFVALPMFDGELGVLPGRAPLIGRLGYGELRIRKGVETRRYFVDGGFAQVRDNHVTVLTARALKPEEINVEAARQALAATHEPAATAEAQEARLKAQERARAQLRLIGQGGQSAPAGHG